MYKEARNTKYYCNFMTGANMCSSLGNYNVQTGFSGHQNCMFYFHQKCKYKNTKLNCRDKGSFSSAESWHRELPRVRVMMIMELIDLF